MGTIRWRASLATVLGVLVPVLISLGSLDRTVSGDHRATFWQIWDVAILIVMPVLAVLGGVSRLEVGEGGIAVWPLGTKLRWSQIRSFDASGSWLGLLRVHRTDRVRPASLAAYPISTKRARALADRLNAELSAS